MQNQFTVILDACVLYNAPVRDILLQLASQGVFRVKWTIKIQEEWMSNLLKNRPDLKKEQLERTCERMNKAIIDCLVEDFEALTGGVELPDPNDAHVVAVAIKSQAQMIITYNLKDFSEEVLLKYQLEAQHPDDFLRSQLDLYPAPFLSSIKTIRSRLKNPSRTAQEYLFNLFQHIPQTVNILKLYVELI